MHMVSVFEVIGPDGKKKKSPPRRSDSALRYVSRGEGGGHYFPTLYSNKKLAPLRISSNVQIFGGNYKNNVNNGGILSAGETSKTPIISQISETPSKGSVCLSVWSILFW